MSVVVDPKNLPVAQNVLVLQRELGPSEAERILAQFGVLATSFTEWASGLAYSLSDSAPGRERDYQTVPERSTERASFVRLKRK
jgi:hypothetical protein